MIYVKVMQYQMLHIPHSVYVSQSVSQLSSSPECKWLLITMVTFH